MFAEAKRRQNANFAAGVLPFDIGRRVFFRIAVVLREFERVFKGHLLFNHHCENKVGRAVENAGNFIDFVGGKALGNRADNRNPAADRRFKQKVDVVFFRHFQKLIAFCRDQFLVGGDNAFARF